MTSKHLISKTLDPIFALAIGATSAWVRIRREETERYEVEFDKAIAAGGGQSPNSPKISSSELWKILKQRIHSVDLSNWDVRKAFNRKEKWGIVDP